MSRLPKLALVIALSGMFAIAATVTAQRPMGKRPGYGGKRPGAQRPNIPKEEVRFTGTIKGMQGALVYVAGEGGQEWLVKIPDRGQGVSVNGAGTRAWLERGARGMLVRFVGTFDAAGKPQAPLNEIYVFTPRPGGGGRGADELKPGVFPEAASAELKALFRGDDAKPVAPKTMDFRVVGQFAGFGNNTITVAAGRTRVSAKLADDARISVSSGDLRHARVGDKIEVDGWHLPMMPSRVFANRLTITASMPLGEKPQEGQGEQAESATDAAE